MLFDKQVLIFILQFDKNNSKTRFKYVLFIFFTNLTKSKIKLKVSMHIFTIINIVMYNRQWNLGGILVMSRLLYIVVIVAYLYTFIQLPIITPFSLQLGASYILAGAIVAVYSLTN